MRGLILETVQLVGLDHNLRLTLRELAICEERSCGFGVASSSVKSSNSASWVPIGTGRLFSSAASRAAAAGGVGPDTR
jgi:hypothetical protein